MAFSSFSSSRAEPRPVRGWRRGAIALALLVAACGGQDIHTGLSEREANEIVAVLGTAGVGATKAAGEKNTWSVAVPNGDFARAVEVLRANGLPREQFETLGTVFKKEGFTSSPLSERARLIYGLSQELSHTISDIDGVVEARVHVTMPEPAPLSRVAPPASASVFVKYRPGFDLRNQTGAIKSLVTNGVEGLTYERVSVVMLPARPLPVTATAGWSNAAPTLAAIVGVAGLLIAALILGRRVPARWRRMRTASTAVAPSNPT